LDNRIDPHLFIDDDGRLYLYMVRFTDGNTIWVRPMLDPATFAGDPRYVFASQAGNWETLDNRVEEGPWVIKYRDRYYLMFNTNHTSTEWGNYMLGVAEAEGPLDFNHGNKYPHPVMQSNQIELEERFVDLLQYGTDGGAFYYSFEEQGDNWFLDAHRALNWEKGRSGFGFPVVANSSVREVNTEWKSPVCCLYKPFLFDSKRNGNLSLRIHHRGEARVWLNGTEVYAGLRPDYLHVDLGQRRSLLRDGENVLAVEGKAGFRSNFLDVALFDMQDQRADDILMTPGQPNILKGPNGFEWWLIYMANKNNERRGQYIDRVHFFDRKLTVDGITAGNTPGYHAAPSLPDYQYLSNNNQLLPPANVPLPAVPASHYYFEAGVKPAAHSQADGIIAWQGDENHWLRIVIDGVRRQWSYTLNDNGNQQSASYPLAADFRPDVFHTLTVFKNHTQFTVSIDHLPAPGQALISTPFAGKGLPGIYSERQDAQWDGIAYTAGWDEHGSTVSGWTASPTGLQLKGDLLDAYELSLQASTASGEGSAGIYPVYIDANNYLKVDFDFTARQCLLTAKARGKTIATQTLDLARLQEHYASMPYSDYMERRFVFDAPAAIDALIIPRAAPAENDTLIGNLLDVFSVYSVQDGKWQELTGARPAEWYHPGFERIEFPTVETQELIFLRKGAVRENFRMQNLVLQKIRVSETFKHSYNLRAVKSRDSIRLFVDGKPVCKLPNPFGNSQVALELNNASVDGITLYHTPAN
jgi:hypothetical protein